MRKFVNMDDEDGSYDTSLTKISQAVEAAVAHKGTYK